MRKALLLLISTLLVIAVGACTRFAVSEPLEPVGTETADFDMDTAISMIEPGDRLIADLQTKDTVTRQEYETFIREVSAAYDGFAEPNWEYMFFDNREIENEERDTLNVNKTLFFPTMFHEGFEVTSAQITTICYEDRHNDLVLLKIREEYTGGIETMKDWYREYTYKKNAQGGWDFDIFGGASNFCLSDKGLSLEDFKLK